MLRLYLDGRGVSINRAAADVNQDGNINAMDLTLLRLFLDGHITLPHS